MMSERVLNDNREGVTRDAVPEVSPAIAEHNCINRSC